MVIRARTVILDILVNFFYGFICIFIYLSYICNVILNPLILTFMRNTFILSHFLNFLNEQEVFTSYLKNVMACGEHSYCLLQVLFFTCQPDGWLTGAFSWDEDPSNDWRAINKLWQIRLSTIRLVNSFDN